MRTLFELNKQCSARWHTIHRRVNKVKVISLPSDEWNKQLPQENEDWYPIPWYLCERVC